MCIVVSYSPRSGVGRPVLVFEIVRHSTYRLRQDPTHTGRVHLSSLVVLRLFNYDLTLVE